MLQGLLAGGGSGSAAKKVAEKPKIQPPKVEEKKTIVKPVEVKKEPAAPV